MDAKTRYKIIADAIFLGHTTFNFYMIGGSLASLAFPAYAPFHVVVIVATALINYFGGGCPLTSLERTYRFLYDRDCTYGETFYGHYVFNKLLGIQVTKKHVTIFLFVTKILPVVIPIAVFAQTISK